MRGFFVLRFSRWVIPQGIENERILNRPMIKPSSKTKGFLRSLPVGAIFLVVLLLGCLPQSEQNGQALPNSSGSSSPDLTQQAEENGVSERTFQVKFDELVEEFDPLVKQWTKDYRRANRAEREELLKVKPAKIYGDKLFGLYEDHAGQDAARAALEKAITLGLPAIKTKAAEKMLKLAADQKPEIAEQTYALIARRGWGKMKTKSIRILADIAKTSTDDDVAIRHLQHALIAKGRAEAGIVAELGEFFWNKIADDLKSDTAARILILLGQHGAGEIRENAFAALLEHHPSSDQLSVFLANVPHRPSAVTEQVLEALCQSKDGAKRMRAAVELSKYYRRRASYRGFYGPQNKEEAIKKIGRPLFEYLIRPNDPGETKALRKVLFSDFEGDSDFIAEVKEQRYIVDNFSIGSQAIETVGKDLDGVEFRLSDYRGKVVLLDFWGDW